MIKSMTGYGRRETAWNDGVVAVEMRAVNHRYCEVMLRLPKTLAQLEDRLKRVVTQQVARGRVDVTVSLQGQRNGAKAVSLDRSLAKQYHRAFSSLQRELKLPGSVDLSTLASARDVLTVSEQPVGEDRRLEQTVRKLLAGALSDLDGMRRREGKALSLDIVKRLRAIAVCRDRIERRIPVAVQEYFSRMKDRVAHLIGKDKVDETRLCQELASYADRCDVTEEVIRLGSHVTQFKLAMKSKESVGRTLDFLLQEMGREVNTVGSKANDSEVSLLVVKMKGELEKIREQVQNIE